MSGTIYGNGPVWLDPTWWGGRYYPANGAPDDIGTIQSALAEQLGSYFSGAGLSIPIYVFPDFDLDTWWQSSAIAFVLISYHGAKFGPPMVTDAMVQERTLSFTVHVEARQTAWALTGAGSVYALIDAIDDALSGFRAAAWRNAYFSDERFSEQDPEGRVWLYDMRLEVPTLKVKQPQQYKLANLIQARVYVAAQGLANGKPISAGSYTFADGTLTLPAPCPLVVAAVTNGAGTTLYQENADYTYDGTTGLMTAVTSGQIGASDTVGIAWAPADTVTVS